MKFIVAAFALQVLAFQAYGQPTGNEGGTAEGAQASKIAQDLREWMKNGSHEDTVLGNSGRHTITFTKKQWEAFSNWKGKAELKQLSADILKLCGQPQNPTEAQAAEGIVCIERELAKYTPKFKTHKEQVKLSDGSTAEATIVDREIAPAEKSIPVDAIRVIYYETSACGEIARLSAEENEKSYKTRYLISSLVSSKISGDDAKKIMDEPVDASKVVPAVIRGYNCYANFFTAYSK